MTWHAHIITIFPELFPGTLGCSIIGRALEQDIWSLDLTNPRDFTTDKHRTIDGTPSGGGAGMVIRADILSRTLNHIRKTHPDIPLFYLSPRGKTFTQQTARSFSKLPGMILLCGRFEGVDQRFLDYYQVQELSLGDFVLAGGEVAAMTVLESIIRLLPDVLGSQTSLEDESFENGLLEYPQYTRPPLWKDQAIPEILLSGHHGKIKQWRLDQSKQITRERRPDLWQNYQAHSKAK